MLFFYFKVCRKQTEICRFCFPFAANKRKLTFSVGSVFRSEMYKHVIYIEMNMKIDMNLKRHMDIDQDMDMDID
jgi:hypothetical protein